MKLLLLPNDHPLVTSYKPYSRVVCCSVTDLCNTYSQYR